jgi:hypothetical protein
MRNPFRRAVRVPSAVRASARLSRGEKVLAGVQARSGDWLLGTRDALVVVPSLDPAVVSDAVRIPWETVERADWNRDEGRLVVAEVGEYGGPRPQHRFSVDDPGLLLEMVRERVTASVVLQRRIVLAGRNGLFVVARRAPSGGGEVTWAYEFDAGVDPRDPGVMAAAEQGLAAARQELGL